MDLMKEDRSPIRGSCGVFERKIELNDLILIEQRGCQSPGFNRFNNLWYAPVPSVHKDDTFAFNLVPNLDTGRGILAAEN
jgi:hypothetical protein